MFISDSLFWNKTKKVLDAISDQGFNYDTVIRCEELMKPLTSMNFNLVGFTKNKSTDLFVGILKIENIKTLYNNYVKGDKHNFEEGLFTDKSTFHSIEKLIIEEQIYKKGDYSGFPKKMMHEISSEIILGKYNGKLKNGKNTLFVPAWGLSDAFLDIKKTKIKSQNLFRIELNENVAYNEYVMFFINSDIGKAYRESTYRIKH